MTHMVHVQHTEKQINYEDKRKYSEAVNEYTGSDVILLVNMKIDSDTKENRTQSTDQPQSGVVCSYQTRHTPTVIISVDIQNTHRHMLKKSGWTRTNNTRPDKTHKQHTSMM